MSKISKRKLWRMVQSLDSYLHIQISYLTQAESIKGHPKHSNTMAIILLKFLAGKKIKVVMVAHGLLRTPGVLHGEKKALEI